MNVEKSKDATRILLSELIFLSKKNESDTVKSLPHSPRPLHVKKTLDEVLLGAGVSFRFNTFAVGEVRDDQGELRGALLASRSGRQTIVAKKVLDARSKPKNFLHAEFAVIGAKPNTSIELDRYPLLKSVRAVKTGKPYHGPVRPSSTDANVSSPDYPIVNYRFEINVPAGTDPFDMVFQAELERQIRLAVYQPQQFFTADEIYFGPPGATMSEYRKRGRELAAEALKSPAPDKKKLAVVSEDRNGEAIVGDVRESILKTRFDEAGPMLSSPRRAIPVLAEYDIVVVGGGTTGAPAGIAAARQGARTLVLEHLHDLGGVGTAGGISVYWYGNRVGFTREVQNGAGSWLIETKTQWWRKKLEEAGADAWHGVLVNGVLLEGNRVRGVLAATPFGEGIVTAKVVIDATGNADVAAAAGAPTEFVNDLEIASQGAGLAWRNLGESYANTDYMFVDDTDVIDSTHVFVCAKERFSQAFDLGKLLGTRERRRIVGEFTFSVLDQINDRTYPDSIVHAFSDYDTHGYTVDSYMELNHPHPRKLFSYVPYRCCIPRGLDGLLVGGLATSCHRDALPIIRMQPDLQNQGYALGCAGAFLAENDEPRVRNLDIRRLQKHLVEIGNLKPEVLDHLDNYGETRRLLPEYVRKLPDDFKNRAPLVMWYPDDARPLVRQAYLQTSDPAAKNVYAKTAAALGDSVGIETILEIVEGHEHWDRGWDFCAVALGGGAATSPLDQWIMFLGRLKDRRATKPIIRLLKQLDCDSDFSHHRAAITALENIGGPEAAAALAEHLAKPGMTGYVHDTIEKARNFDRESKQGIIEEKTRRDSLIEISTARALYRCGDKDGRGEEILRKYKSDLRGHFARHAMEILSSTLQPPNGTSEK